MQYGQNDIDEESHAAECVRFSQQNPLYHIVEIQGVNSLLDYQVRIINAVKNYDRIAVKACHGVGKTFVAARLVTWFLPTFPHSKIITTAPTGRLVKKLLWSEIKTAHSRSRLPLGGELTSTEWNIDHDWFAIGYSPQKEADADRGLASSFQGFHAPKMLFVLDEATGVKKQVWDQMEGMTTGEYFKIVAIANPTSKTSVFYSCFHGPKSVLWHNQTIKCFDSPNVKANEIKTEIDLRKEIVQLRNLDLDGQIKRMRDYKVPNKHVLTLKWVMERAIEWGIDHPLFRSKVLSEFPEYDDNALFNLSGIVDATLREPPEREKIQRRIFGVDPAGDGNDKIIITMMEDEKVYPVIRLPKSKDSAPQLEAKMIYLLRQTYAKEAEDTLVLIDSTGVGHYLSQYLEVAKQKKLINAHIFRVQFGGKAEDKRDPEQKQIDDKSQYANFKAKIFSLLSKDIGTVLCLPPNEIDHDIYMTQLPTILFALDDRGRVVIESKKKYRKRTSMGSPDESDALAIANIGRHMRLVGINAGPKVWRV